MPALMRMTEWRNGPLNLVSGLRSLRLSSVWFGACGSCPSVTTAEASLAGHTAVFCTPWRHQVATAVYRSRL